MAHLKNRYHFKRSQSPTVINLQRTLHDMGWRAGCFARLAHFSDQNLTFDEEAANTLEYKHLLSGLCQKYCADVIPQTFYIDDSNWTSVLQHILHEKQEKKPWILKPALMNNGQGIHLFQTAETIEAHYLSSNRYGGPHVLQRYIQHPHLLKGHKYSIRIFAILTSHQGAFLYSDGYFNVARTPYSSDRFDQLRAHITNEHLHDQENNVIQIPTREFEFFKDIYPQIKHIMINVTQSLQKARPCAFLDKKIPRFAFFGFDFLIDTQLRAWLLEANHGPCFPVSEGHPLQNYLYKPFWQDFINTFIVHTSASLPQEGEVLGARGFTLLTLSPFSASLN